MRRKKFFPILKKDRNTMISARSGSITSEKAANPKALTGANGSPGPIRIHLPNG